MGRDQANAVLDCSRQEGSHLLLLLIIALNADQSGEWRTDQAALQRQSRLSRRRVQEILADLVASGELSVASHHGRGRLSTYRLQVGEKVQPVAPFPEPTRSPEAPEKGAAHRTFSARKGAAGRTFPAPPSPPFPLDPQIPLYPPQIQETSGLRPLTGPQSAVLRVKLLLEEAGVPLPTPAQIGLWSKTLGGIEPLLELLARLIQAGLANKREPIVYAHRVVMERAAHPEPVKPRDARAGRDRLLAAGADETRWQQALDIIATTEES